MRIGILIVILLAAAWTYSGFPDFVNWKAMDLPNVFETRRDCETHFKDYIVLCVPTLESMR